MDLASENCISKRFTGGQILFERKDGSRRPITNIAEVNITIVREMIEEGCHLSCPSISKVADIEVRTTGK